jgi:hypothetical protein
LARIRLSSLRSTLGYEPLGSEPFDELRVSSRAEKLDVETLRVEESRGTEHTSRQINEPGRGD